LDCLGWLKVPQPVRLRFTTKITTAKDAFQRTLRNNIIDKLVADLLNIFV
jgi:hypothetical protein